MSEVVYTGFLRKGDEPGTIVGELVDVNGWVLSIFGTIRKEGGYSLSATVGEPPACLKFPLLDDAK